MTATFRAYEVDRNQYLDRILVHNPRATLSADLLPRRVRLASAWVNQGGRRLRSWCAIGETSVISLPTVEGDGSQDLEQLKDWLGLNGYTRTSADDDPEAVYERQD